MKKTKRERESHLVEWKVRVDGRSYKANSISSYIIMNYKNEWMNICKCKYVVINRWKKNEKNKGLWLMF